MLENILTWLFPPQCGGCDSIGTGMCLACMPDAEPLELSTATLRVRALASYEGAVRRAVLELKNGRRDVATSLGERLAAIATRNATLIPVPTTRARRAVRGFDGAELLAKCAARIAPADVQCVLKQIAGDAQRGRNRSDRLAARGRFRCMQRFDGVEVVLVDDVMTTGSTLEDCAATLRAAGAVVREAIVVAVRKPEGRPERERRD